MKEREIKNINFDNISNSEKLQLKNRITYSIYSYIQRKRRIKYGASLAAASVIVLISIGIFNKIQMDSSSIENFVKTTEDDNIEIIQNVNLILNNNQNIEIAEENSTITYSNTGEEVKIGDSKSLNQESSKNSPIVFNTLIVPYGKRSEIKLSDGSKIWLNSGSKLVFPATFIKNKREVYLEGEAIFEVAHDKKRPFIVKANNHEIEVLGTVFNVSNYMDENSIRTVLKSGSVQINFKKESFINPIESVKITPGIMAVYNRNNKAINTQSVDIEKHFSWREGIFIFKNDPLHVIMKKISRYYNVNISIDNEILANQTFSGYLDVKDNVENVINTVKESTDFQFEINNKTITIN